MNSPIDQQFTGPCKDCKFWPIYRIDDNHGWNDWKILTSETAKGHDEEEYEDVMAVTLRGLGDTIPRSVGDGHFGGYEVCWGNSISFIL